MFIRSSTAINDCLIALDTIAAIFKDGTSDIAISPKTNFSLNNVLFKFFYDSEKSRDKAFNELCEFLNNNCKLRDFT